MREEIDGLRSLLGFPTADGTTASRRRLERAVTSRRSRVQWCRAMNRENRIPRAPRRLRDHPLVVPPDGSRPHGREPPRPGMTPVMCRTLTTPSWGACGEDHPSPFPLTFTATERSSSDQGKSGSSPLPSSVADAAQHALLEGVPAAGISPLTCNMASHRLRLRRVDHQSPRLVILIALGTSDEGPLRRPASSAPAI